MGSQAAVNILKLRLLNFLRGASRPDNKCSSLCSCGFFRKKDERITESCPDTSLVLRRVIGSRFLHGWKNVTFSFSLKAGEEQEL